MPTMKWLCTLVLVATVVGCAGDMPDPETPGPPAQASTPASGHGSACDSPRAAPLQVPMQRSVSVGGHDRHFTISLPASYSGRQRAPVIVAVHGAGQTAAVLASDANLERDAWARGHIVISPDAVDGMWDFLGNSDVNYFDTLLDAVEAEFCLDPERVFMAGMSQGGDFASFFACHAPGRVAAVASVAVLNFPEQCETWSPTPVLAFIGLNDPIYRPDLGLDDEVPFSGDPGQRPGPLSAEAAAWAAANGCAPEPSEVPGDSQTASMSFACPDGAEVEYLLHDGGHTWPGGSAVPGFGPAVPELPANEIMLDFFARTDQG